MPIGNPAPLGLLAFGMTTMLLMYVDMGLVETEFEEMVIGYAFFYGGVCQLLVGIFELFKGATLPFAVFGSYGAFWLGWAFVKLNNEAIGINFTGDYTGGKVAYYVQWGVLTFCFWIVSFRKNMCLVVVLGLLWVTFFMLAASVGTGSNTVKVVAGSFGFCTAVAAWYTAMAEIINEEWGRHVLPGLKPLHSPERDVITKDLIVGRANYDAMNKTLFLQFRGLHINTLDDVHAIKDGIEYAIKHTRESRVHVVVNYDEFVLSDIIAKDYWSMTNDLQQEYYLSVKRFHVSSFGTKGQVLQQGAIQTQTERVEEQEQAKGAGVSKYGITL
jgi:succinate-acetate transporter protein